MSPRLTHIYSFRITATCAAIRCKNSAAECWPSAAHAQPNGSPDRLQSVVCQSVWDAAWTVQPEVRPQVNPPSIVRVRCEQPPRLHCTQFHCGTRLVITAVTHRKPTASRSCSIPVGAVACRRHVNASWQQGGPCEALMEDGPGSPGGVGPNVKEAGSAICSFSAVPAADGCARMAVIRKE
jgi:hypothetical protein